MGFVKDMTKFGAFGLANAVLNKSKKKPPADIAMRPSMISTALPDQRPPSMIGSQRGGY